MYVILYRDQGNIKNGNTREIDGQDLVNIVSEDFLIKETHNVTTGKAKTIFNKNITNHRYKPMILGVCPLEDVFLGDLIDDYRYMFMIISYKDSVSELKGRNIQIGQYVYPLIYVSLIKKGDCFKYKLTYRHCIIPLEKEYFYNFLNDKKTPEQRNKMLKVLRAGELNFFK